MVFTLGFAVRDCNAQLLPKTPLGCHWRQLWAASVSRRALAAKALPVAPGDLHIEDFDSTIPGHGGLLDRFDSLVPIASAVFHYVNYFVGIGDGQRIW